MNANPTITKSSSLGDQVAEWNRIFEQRDYSLQDIALFGGPSECERAIFRRVEREAKIFLEKHGYYDYQEFKQAVIDRTSYRWVYLNLRG